MSFRNAFKIMVRKFYVVGALLLYYALSATLVGLAGWGVLAPFMSRFEDINVFNQIAAIMNSLFGGVPIIDVLEMISRLIREIYGVLNNSIAATVGIGLFLLLVIGVFARFLFGLSELATACLLQAHMSMNAKFGFFNMFIRSLGKSSVYQLSRMIFTLPLDAIIMFLLANVAKLSKFSGMQVPAMFLLLISAVLLFSLRYAAFSGWAPAIATKDGKNFDAMLLGFKSSFPHFSRCFGATAVMWACVLTVNIFVAFLTFCAGLILTIPISAFLFNILNMTLYYANTGKRYYIDKDTVITSPSKDSSPDLTEE